MQLTLQLSTFEENTLCCLAVSFLSHACFCFESKRVLVLIRGAGLMFEKQEASEHENSPKVCGQQQMDDQNIMNNK